MRRWITTAVALGVTASMAGVSTPAQAQGKTLRASQPHDTTAIDPTVTAQVPEEVWQHILHVMPPRQRLQTMVLDKRWINLGSQPLLWMSGELTFLTDEELDQLEKLSQSDKLRSLITAERASRVMTTIAGTGTEGFAGDGGPAVNAQLNDPRGMAIDKDGNLYIADDANQRIRKIDAKTGLITTIAGNGTRGFSGDGGPAVNAQLRHPQGVAVDATGNVYIADMVNNRIRKVDTAGIITTIAGNEWGFAGDGGPAVNAQLRYPQGVAVDRTGNLYIADTGNNRVRKVDTIGTITTIAGGRWGLGGFCGDDGPAVAAQLHDPQAMAVDATGNVYIADTHHHWIRKVDTTGTITLIADDGMQGFAGDGGPAIRIDMGFPGGVVADKDGNVIFTSTLPSRVHKIDAATGLITTLAGEGTQGFAGDGGPAARAHLNYPMGVVVAEDGSIYVADAYNHRIRKFRLARADHTDR